MSLSCVFSRCSRSKNLSAHTTTSPSFTPNRKTEPKGPNLGDLPVKLLQEITLHLSQCDIGSLRLVSKACLRIDIKYMQRTLCFSLSLSGLARLRLLSSLGALTSYVHHVTFRTDWKDDLTAEADLQLQSLVSDQQFIIANLLNRGSPSSRHASKKAMEITRYALKAWSERPAPDCEDRLSHTFVRRYVYASVSGMRNLKSFSVYENRLCFRWEKPNHMSITRVTTDMLPTVRGNTGWRSSLLAPSILKHLSKRCHIITTCEITLHSFINRPGINRLADSFHGCLRPVRPTLRKLSLKIANIDLQYPQRCHPHAPYTVSDRHLDDRIRSRALSFVLYDLPELEDLEMTFCYVRLPLPTHQSTSNVPNSADRFNEYFQLIRPEILLNFHRLRNLHIEGVAIEAACLTDLLRRNRETLRKLSLAAIEWVPESSVLAWFYYVRSVLGGLEEARFRGIHTETKQERSIDMDAIFYGSLTSEEAAEDSKNPGTVGDRLGEICLARTPMKSHLRVATLSWLERRMPYP